MKEYKFLYLAKKTTDLTGAIHLDILTDDMVVELHGDDEFVTLVTKVDLYAV